MGESGAIAQQLAGERAGADGVRIGGIATGGSGSRPSRLLTDSSRGCMSTFQEGLEVVSVTHGYNNNALTST